MLFVLAAICFGIAYRGYRIHHSAFDWEWTRENSRRLHKLGNRSSFMILFGLILGTLFLLIAIGNQSSH